MGRRFLLSAIAVGMIASVASAGKLTANYDINVSKEWVLQNKLNDRDSNITIDTLNVNYVPTDIPAGSLDNPTLNIDFYGVKAIDVNTSVNLGICELGNDGNTSILKYDHIDTTNNKIVFKAIKSENTMGNSKKYFICDTDTNNTSSAYGIILKLDPDASNAKMEFKLYSGDSQELNDHTNQLIVDNKVSQLCAKVTTSANAQIDPATGFMAFGENTTTTSSGCTSTTTSNTDKTDKIIISFYDNKSLIKDANYEIGNYAILANIKASNELPIDINNTTYTLTGTGTQEDLSIVDNKIFKMAAKNVDYTNTPSLDNETNMTLTITVTGDKPLNETKFTAEIGFNLLNKTDSFTKDYSTLEDAGAWTYKGTTVEIPYVVKNSDTNTIIRLTNGQSVNANVYWTCTDNNGITVANIQVPAATLLNGEKYVPANGAATWLASDILQEARTQNPDFATGNKRIEGKMKCKALVTATSGVNGVAVMMINGGRDRVIPVRIRNND